MKTLVYLTYPVAIAISCVSTYYLALLGEPRALWFLQLIGIM